MDSKDTLHTAASVWLVRLERGLQPAEGSKLREWLRDPAQRDAIIDAAKLYHGPDILAVLATLVPVGFGNPPAPPPRRRVHPLMIGVAVMFGLAVALAPFVVVHRTMPGVLSHEYRPALRPLPWGEELYTTRGAETRRVTLPDGSQLALNGHTQAGVLYGAGLRLVMLQYGEALVEVRSEARPFEITAAGRRFKALPSRFDVRVISPQAVELTVLEGDVTVRGLPWRRPATPSEARLFDPRVFADTQIGPMQAVVLEDSIMSRYPVTAANLSTKLRWQPQNVLYVTP